MFRRILKKPDRGDLRTILILAACLLGRPGAASMAAGAVLMAAGGALHLWSKGCLHQNRVLAACGPYRLTRNPFYLANLVIESGIAVLSGVPWLLPAYLLLWIPVYLRAIAREERRLAGIFGEEFHAYRRRVPRLFPRPFRAAPRMGGGSFSWRNPNLARGREYARLVRQGGVIPLVWLASSALRRGPAILLDLGGPPGLALVLLVAAKGLEWSLVLRFKKQRALPGALQRPELRAAILAGLLVAALGLPSWEGISGEGFAFTGLTLLVLWSVVLPVLPERSWSRASVRRAMEGGIVLAGGLLLGRTIPAIAGFAIFAALAIDRAGRPGVAAGRVRERPAPGW